MVCLPFKQVIKRWCQVVERRFQPWAEIGFQSKKELFIDQIESPKSFLSIQWTVQVKRNTVVTTFQVCFPWKSGFLPRELAHDRNWLCSRLRNYNYRLSFFQIFSPKSSHVPGNFWKVGLALARSRSNLWAFFSNGWMMQKLRHFHCNKLGQRLFERNC